MFTFTYACVLMFICYCGNYISGISLEYILYRQNLTWNQAHAFCTAVGGSLATVETPDDVRLLTDLDASQFVGLRDIAFWIGLTMTGSDRYTWVPDCVDLSPTYSYMFDSGVQGQRMCYTLDLPSGRATSRGCNATYPFLCQHKQENVSCDYKTVVVSRGWDYWYPNQSVCQTVCDSMPDGACWGIAIYKWDRVTNETEEHYEDCYTLTNETTRTRDHTWTHTIAQKSCYRLRVDANTQPVSTNTDIWTKQTNTGSANANLWPLHACPNNFSSTTTMSSAPTTTENYTAIKEVFEKAEEYVKNLTVSVTSTSSYVRSKTSADDDRESSRYVGVMGILMVVVPFAVILVLDIPRLVSALQSYDNVLNRRLPATRPR